MLTDGLIAFLNANSAVAALANSRIGPPPAPEDLTLYPCITYQRASYTPDYTDDGDLGFSETRIVFDCFALRYMDARNLADAVRQALTGYRGTLTDGTIVDSIEIANVIDGWLDGSRIYRTSVHAIVNYTG